MNRFSQVFHTDLYTFAEERFWI